MNCLLDWHLLNLKTNRRFEMDDKGKEIAFQVAWKAAVDLVVAGKAIIDPTKAVGDEINLLAHDLYQPLLASLLGLHGHPTPAASTPAGQAGEPPLLTSTACPDCAGAGRTGVLLHNTDPTYRGPEFKCSLQQVRKAGDKWVEIGPCAYVNWGRNSKKS